MVRYEGAAGALVRPQLKKEASGGSGMAGIDHAHFPISAIRPENFHLAVAEIYGDIAVGHVVAEKIIFRHLALVAQRQDELLQPMVGIAVHDVPDDRLSPDFHHRLGFNHGLFRQPSPQPSADTY